MVEGDGEPFFRLALDQVLSCVSNRDLLQWGEASVKDVLLSLLSLSAEVSVYSEWETNRGYADLVLVPRPGAAWLRHAWMVELKYLKKKADSPEARQRVVTEGWAQIRQYLGDEKRMAYLRRFKLHTVVALYVDASELVWEEDALSTT